MHRPISGRRLDGSTASTLLRELRRRLRPLPFLVVALLGCPQPHWQQVFDPPLPAALLSVWGTSASDVWTVGADPKDGKGPLVLHFDGTRWTRLESGQVGDLWWVFGFKDGPVYAGGAGGQILKITGGSSFTKMQTPGNDGVFGIWGASPTDVWAVGGAVGGASGAFAWRLQGDAWVEAPGFPAALNMTEVMWKVSGRSASDVWIVGTNGQLVHWDGTALTRTSAMSRESLFTVAANTQGFTAVGGFGTGSILENTGGGWAAARLAPGTGALPALVGVALTEQTGYAVGDLGAVYRRDPDGWREEPTELTVNGNLHGVWIDPGGDVWTVGGEIATFPLTNGVLLHRGRARISSEIPGLGK